MTLITYLKSLPSYTELEESIARSRVLYPSTTIEDSYYWNENQTIHNYSYDWNDIA